MNENAIRMIKNMLPNVLGSNFSIIKFDPAKIYESLISETNIDNKICNNVVIETTRYFIKNTKITTITSPMIREVVNSILLEHGLEKERLQYTRIGFPHKDLLKLYENGEEYANKKILEHIKKEFENVNKLIEKMKTK